MKRRSPYTILWLSVLTLTFYDLYWFGATRNELARLSGVRLRGVAWLALVGITRVLGIIGVIWLFFALFVTSVTGSAMTLLILFIVVGAVATLVILPAWLIPYTKAAQIATGGRINASNSILLLLVREPFGITLLQQAYNNPQSMPEFMSLDSVQVAANASQKVQEYENPVLKRILSAIIIIMIVGLILFFLFIFLAAHL